jgi:prepilin-type N-terminal cleavage/methylation domain-containing protein
MYGGSTMSIRNKKAFTLIEMLVVVLIIGILAAIALPQYRLAVNKSRTAQIMSLIKNIGQAQQMYYLTNDKYAEKFEDLDISLPNNTVSCAIGGDDTDCKEIDGWKLRLYAESYYGGIYLAESNASGLPRIRFTNKKVNGQKGLGYMASLTDIVANKICQLLGGRVTDAGITSDNNFYALN